jgi:hypothetical protein
MAQAGSDCDHHHHAIQQVLNQVYPLQALQEEAFLGILDGAVRFNMPKLLACCAHRIAVDFSDQSGLWLPSLLEEHLPLSSAVRIAAALRELIRRYGVLSSRSYYMSGPISFLRPERYLL